MWAKINQRQAFESRSETEKSREKWEVILYSIIDQNVKIKSEQAKITCEKFEHESSHRVGTVSLKKPFIVLENKRIRKSLKCPKITINFSSVYHRKGIKGIKIEFDQKRIKWSSQNLLHLRLWWKKEIVVKNS